MNIYHILKEVKDHPSTTKKEEILEFHLSIDVDGSLRTVLDLALNPRIRFGVVLPPNTADHAKEFPDNMPLLTFLRLLKEHEYSFTTKDEKETLMVWISQLAFEDAQVAVAMINGDLNIGVGTTVVNKVLKKLGMEEIRVLRPMKAYKEKGDNLPDPPFRMEVKIDAARAFMVVGEEGAYFLTSTGNRIDCFTHITTPISRIRTAVRKSGEVRNYFDSSFVVDGELVGLTDTGAFMDRKKSNGLLNKAVAGTLPKDVAERFTFVAWDYLPSSDKDPEIVLYEGCDEPAKMRREQLVSLIDVHLIDCYDYNNPAMLQLVDGKIVNSKAEAYEYAAELIANGEEGAIAKSLDYPYKPKRSTHLVKLKKAYMADVRITGLNEGKNPGTLGSFSYETDDGKISGDFSGIKQAVKKHAMEHPEEYIGRVAEVRYMELTVDKRTNKTTLYGPPVFIRLRDDKNETSTIEELQ